MKSVRNCIICFAFFSEHKSLILMKQNNMKREKVIDTVNNLPQEFELDELLEKLILVEKVENGLKQLESNQVIPHEQVKEIAKKW